MNYFKRQGGQGDDLQVPDQRSYDRIRMILGFVVRQEGQRDINIFTDDVSPTGIRFISQKPLEKGQHMILYVSLEGSPTQIAIKAHTAWVQQDGPHQFTGGIAFDEMNPADRALWVRFIDANKAPAS
jgi:hypothetical protein